MSTYTQRKAAAASAADSDGPEPDANPYLAGEVIGDRYRLDREIGRGGMGVVWVAHSLVLGVDVAVKLIRAETAGAGLATRMAREAHAAARLGHPALVRVFDFGWTNRGDPFLVMELVQGETLTAKLQREGPMPAIRAVQTLLPIADGLRLAHERSIVHRDIKPDNILLAADALGRIQPKLLDFGIAKVGHTPTDGKLTQVGAVLGSPEYMSPEQARGLDTVDARTDVWSLTVALYELLTGDVPFTGANYNALMQAIIHDPASPPRAGDAALWTVLQRGLAKDPADRWASMSTFGEGLALWLYEHGVKEDLSGNSVRAVWLDGPLSPELPGPASTPLPNRLSMTARLAPTAQRQIAFPVPNTKAKAKAIWVAGMVLLGFLLLLLTQAVLRNSKAEPAALKHASGPPLEQPGETHAPSPVPQQPQATSIGAQEANEPPPAPPATVAEPVGSKRATSRQKFRATPTPAKAKRDFGF